MTAKSGGRCTGTLISPTRVLTAGHCLDNFSASDEMYRRANGHARHLYRTATARNAGGGLSMFSGSVNLHKR